MDLTTYLQDERQALPAALSADDDARAARYQAALASMTYPELSAFLAAIGAFAPCSCLDVGIAYGAQYFALQENFAGVTWTGCEISPVYRAAFAALLPAGPAPAVLAVSDYSSMPEIADGAYDVVTSRSMLCHYGAPHAFAIIDEMLRIAGRAVVIKTYYPPSFDAPVYTELPPDHAGGGWLVEWSLPEWSAYVQGKTVEWDRDTNRTVIIRK